MGHPAESKKQLSQKQRAWQKFIDGLDPEKLMRKQKESKQPLKILSQIPEIPMFNTPPEEKRSEDD